MSNSACRLTWIGSIVCGLGFFAPSISYASPSAAGATSPVGLNSCNVGTLSQPFAGWFDYAQYELAPGGDFESSTWTLTGGAERVQGSEPYAATGTLGSSSLSLPAGSSAQSSPMCVEATYPSIRFFIAGQGSVSVSVVDGGSVIPAGVVAAAGGWKPSPVTLTNSELMAASSGGTTQVSLVFTGLTGSPQVDDVFVDPWSRG